MSHLQATPLSAVPFLRFDERGVAFLAGARCQQCNAVMPGEPSNCACCMARECMEPIRLGERGKLYSYTIVHRSFPGVATPFIAVVVDLEGGGSLQGTLLQVTPAPAAIAYDMALDVVYQETGQRHPDGRPFIAYYFVPSTGEA